MAVLLGGVAVFNERGTPVLDKPDRNFGPSIGKNLKPIPLKKSGIGGHFQNSIPQISLDFACLEILNRTPKSASEHDLSGSMAVRT